MKKIVTLLCVTLFSIATMANGVEVNGIYYLLDSDKMTASVTYTGENYGQSYTNNYIGNIVIPDSIAYNGNKYAVTSIGKGAFYKCSLMTDISIPNTVTKIGYQAFCLCSKLKTLTFPSTTTSVGAYTFTPDMKNVLITCLALTPPNVQYSDLGTFLTVHVPAEVVSKYKKALGWSLQTIKPIMLSSEKNATNNVTVSWLPVANVDKYEICVDVYLSNQYAYTDTLIVLADGANGGTMTSIITSVPIRRMPMDDIGSVVIITIDPNSGSAAGQPFLMTVSTTRADIINCRVKVYASKEQAILKQDQIYFTLNDSSGFLNIRASFEQGLFDLYGHHYSINQWNQLPAGIYILREGEKASKVMKQ